IRGVRKAALLGGSRPPAPSASQKEEHAMRWTLQFTVVAGLLIACGSEAPKAAGPEVTEEPEETVPPACENDGDCGAGERCAAGACVPAAPPPAQVEPGSWEPAGGPRGFGWAGALAVDGDRIAVVGP